jgi:oxygen-dependent protoporphyrinogen oxidase
VGTYRNDSYLVETGANSVLDTTPRIGQLLDELGIAGERVDASAAARKRYVVRHGRPMALPMSPPALLSSPLFSMRAKLRLLREPFVARAAAEDEESVAAFVRRRLGEEFLDYAVDPFVSGVYAGDPDALSMAAAFPRVHALEQTHGGLLRGQIASARAQKRRGEPMQATRSFSFRRGMQTLPEALSRRLAHYVPGCEAVSIEHEPARHWAVRSVGGQDAPGVSARAVVIAIPAWAAAPLIAPLAPAAARALAQIEHPSVAIVAAAYRRDGVTHALDGFGMLVPGREQRKILGTLFSSTLFADRAPDGEVLLTTFAGGRRQPSVAALDDAALASTVEQELAELLGARSPRWSRIIRWPRAIPQYELGHRERVAAVLRAVAQLPGLHLCGSWRDGVAVGDRIVAGYAVADDVAAYLRHSAPAVPA